MLSVAKPFLDNLISTNSKLPDLDRYIPPTDGIIQVYIEHPTPGARISNLLHSPWPRHDHSVVLDASPPGRQPQVRRWGYLCTKVSVRLLLRQLRNSFEIPPYSARRAPCNRRL